MLCKVARIFLLSALACNLNETQNTVQLLQCLYSLNHQKFSSFEACRKKLTYCSWAMQHRSSARQYSKQDLVRLSCSVTGNVWCTHADQQAFSLSRRWIKAGETNLKRKESKIELWVLESVTLGWWPSRKQAREKSALGRDRLQSSSAVECNMCHKWRTLSGSTRGQELSCRKTTTRRRRKKKKREKMKRTKKGERTITN